MLRIKIRYLLNHEGLNYFPSWIARVLQISKKQDGYVALHHFKVDDDYVTYLFFESEEKLSSWIDSSHYDKISRELEQFYIGVPIVDADETHVAIVPKNH
jgi:heme-degrading monooxygenase HmoA